MSRLAEAKQTAHAGIDYEHQIQTGLVQALCDAVEAGREAKAVEEILVQLLRFSEAHFMSEELLMRLASYDHYDDHVADHIHMMDELTRITDEYRNGESAAMLGKAREVLDFILKHIETRDKRFAEWAPS
jgi:hemerythrin